MRNSTQELVRAALFTAIMCVFTIIVRTLQPVLIIPFSLQPLVVMLAACLLSPRAAFLSMLAYVCMGLIGLPVFSKPPYGGLAYIFIPSFGFLLAFPFAACLQSRLIKKSSFLNFVLAGLTGIIVYYIFGLPYLYMILKFYLGQTINVLQVLEIGFIPFIIFDIIKLLISSFLAVEMCRRLNINREIK